MPSDRRSVYSLDLAKCVICYSKRMKGPLARYQKIKGAPAPGAPVVPTPVLLLVIRPWTIQRDTYTVVPFTPCMGYGTQLHNISPTLVITFYYLMSYVSTSSISATYQTIAIVCMHSDGYGL